MLRTWVLLALACQFGCSLGTQVWSCNPTNTDCPPDPALGTVQLSDFSASNVNLDNFDGLDDKSLSLRPSLGGVFTIASENDAPTLSFHKYIFFGQVDVVMQCAPGAGIVTSLVLQSDTLDEIDFEFTGSDKAQCQTNYFSKGNTSTYDRGGFHPVVYPARIFHTYSIRWTVDAIDWMVDNSVVRTLKYSATFPQTPMLLTLGTWVAGKAGAPNGTAEWAGGYADFSHGSFEAIVKSIQITDYGGGVPNATQYIYQNRSGTWDSIKVVAGNITSAPFGSSSSAVPGPSDHSSSSSGGLGTGAIAGIAVGAVLAVLVVSILAFVSLRRRRRKVTKNSYAGDMPYPSGRRELQGTAVSEIDGKAVPSWLWAVFRWNREGLDPSKVVAELPAVYEERHELDGSDISETKFSAIRNEYDKKSAKNG